LKFEIKINHKTLILKTTQFHFPYLDWHQELPYQHGYLEADLDCLKIFNDGNEDSVLKNNVFSFRHRAKTSIILKTKSYNQKDNFKNSSIVFSKLFFFDDSKIKSFEWWIETSKISGFEKMIIFNNSLSKFYKNLFDINVYLIYLQIYIVNHILNFMT